MRRALRVASIVLIGTMVLVAAVIVVVANLVPDLSRGCGWWSEQDRLAVESVPLNEFLGTDQSPSASVCSDSLPETLYRFVQLPVHETLPADWYTRVDVGAWSVSARFSDSLSNGPVLCYTSSSSPRVEVLVTARSAQASMHHDRSPCR